MSIRIKNLGILAHVDAGKTTLTENMLFLSGAIRSAGNVDKGTSLSEGLDVERRPMGLFDVPAVPSKVLGRLPKS